MSSEIQKVSVVDSRILQPKPKFAVEKGPLSLTNVTYRAITATSSQCTYNVIVPSESVFVDRAVDWTATIYGSVDVTLTGTAVTGAPIVVYGKDCALAPFPLHQLCSTMSATINDTTTVVNTNDVLAQLLRLADYKKHRKQRTCPTMLDKHLKYPHSFPVAQSTDAKIQSQYPRVGNSPLSGYENAYNVDEKPNGAWGDFQWTNAVGVVPTATGDTTVAAATGTQEYTLTTFTNGSTQCCYGANVTATQVFRLYFRFKSTERLLISPFIWADDYEVSTGLFGVQNIQLLMNFQNPIGGGRILRFSQVAGQGGNATSTTSVVASNELFQSSVSGGAVQNAAVNVQYLTPSLDVPLPAKSIVPYMDYPRYISQSLTAITYGTIFAGSTNMTSITSQGITSQTITLPAIPDLLVIYARPNTYPTTAGGSTIDPSQCDWVLPITGISVNFDNYAGLLSSHTQEQLYRMSVRNGLEMDWDEWRGYANTSALNNTAYTTPKGTMVPLVGGPLVLKPGRDIVLQAGQAPSLVGNFSLQFNLSVQNQTGESQTAVQLYVIAVNSGFMETIKGSSRIIKGVLTEQDILSAPMGPGSSDAHMNRMLGAGKIEDSANDMDRNGRGSGRSSRHGDHRSSHRSGRNSGMSDYR